MEHPHRTTLAMPEEQFSALLAKLKDDVGLQEKLKGAADLDAAVAIAKEAGFDVRKADWLRYQAENMLKLSDEELEELSGGTANNQNEHLDLQDFSKRTRTMQFPRNCIDWTK